MPPAKHCKQVSGAGGENWAEMGNGEDWLFRPILRGLCDYNALNSLTIYDFAIMNQALDVLDANEKKAQSLANKRV